MLELRNLNKKYSTKNGIEVHAINDVSLTFEEKGMVFLLGKSGSGKSTMLNLIGGLDKADSGEIIIKGKNSKDFSSSDLDSYRNTLIGFIFQDYNLLDEFTLEENIALAFSLQGKKEDKEKIQEILSLVDLAEVGNRKPNTLSGGQKQRIAIARALVKDPEIIMADEPTGALDSKTGKQIFDLLKKLSKNKLVIVVSHDREFAERYADRIIELKDGRVVSDHQRQTIEPKQVSQNVSIVEGKTAVVKNVKKLTERELREILNSISDEDGEAVITAKQDELDNVKQVFGISNDGEKRNFVKTGHIKSREYSEEESKFISSKLPISNALKMGVSGLKAKPIKLAFTIFLSVLAFCMFGVLSTLMLYKPSYTLSKALQASDSKSIVISRGYEYHDLEYHVNADGTEVLKEQIDGERNVLFTPANIASLNNNSVGYDFAGVFNFSSAEAQDENKSFAFDVDFANNDLLEFYKNKSLFGFSDVGQAYLDRNNIKMLVGSYPIGSKEIAVSEYIASMLIDATNYPSTISLDSVVGTYIEIKQSSMTLNLKITGVFEANDLSEYYKYKYRSDEQKFNEERQEKLAMLSDSLKRSFETLGFVSSEFYTANESRIANSYTPQYPTLVSTRGIVINTSDNMPEDKSITAEFTKFPIYTSSRIEKGIDTCSFYNVLGEPINFELAEDEIFLHQSKYEELKNGVCAGNPGEIENLEFCAKNYNGVVKTFKVKGYFTLKNMVSTNYILHDDAIKNFAAIHPHNYRERVSDYVFDETEKYNYVISHSDNSERQINFALGRNGDAFYSIASGSYQKLFSHEVMTLIEQVRKIFIVAAIVVGLFAGLMLYNFISASIVAKRKEIGILRAVGATGKDVFKIFACESAVLTAISFVMASLLAFVVCTILNYVTLGMAGLVFLKYWLVNVLLILLISVSISFIATIVPVVREAKKSPVESIRQL